MRETGGVFEASCCGYPMLSQTVGSVDWMLGGFYFDETVNYDNVVNYDEDMNPYANILSWGGVNDLQQLLQALGQLPPGVGFLESGKGAWNYTGQDGSFSGYPNQSRTFGVTLQASF